MSKHRYVDNHWENLRFVSMVISHMGRLGRHDGHHRGSLLDMLHITYIDIMPSGIPGYCG